MHPKPDTGAPTGGDPATTRLLPGADVHFLCEARPEVDTVLAARDFDSAMQGNAVLRGAFAQDGVLCWTVQTFFRLREAGFEGVTLGTSPTPGAINIAASRQLLREPWWREHFCVAIEADYPRIWWADLQIQQNPANCRAGDVFLPLWPQPALVPRDPTRQGVRSVGFLGKSGGNLALSGGPLQAMLAQEGLTLSLPEQENWNDYSDLDVVVAVRSFDGRRWDNRPASKLINAWRAGVPFIGGPDSAYRAAGTPGHDYLMVETADDLMAALRQLRDDADLYAKLVTNGQAAAQRYSVAALTELWVAAIRGPMAARFELWKRRPARSALVRRIAGTGFDALNLAKALGRVVRGQSWRWP